MADRSAPPVASVRRRREFAELARARAQGRRDGLWVRHLPGDASDPAPVRVAYATPAKVGTAVVRNRIRRRLRAHVRNLVTQDRLRPGGYLIGVTPAAVRLDFADLGAALEAALAAATRSGPERRAS